MAYTDLITFEDVDEGAIESIDLGGLTSVVDDTITDVSATIEDYLDRKLIVRSVSQPIPTDDWLGNPYDPDETVMALADQWPVVETVTSGVSIGYQNQWLVETDDKTQTVSYFAGYKRPDQTLSDLQGESGLSALTATPDNLPRQIRHVAIRLVLYYLQEVDDRIMGRRNVQTSGPVTLNVEGADTGFVMRELKRLSTFRRRI